MGFNPYRVFSGLATIPSRSAFGADPRFNPYRVFSGLATWSTRPKVEYISCFNPYRVFSGLATNSQTSDSYSHSEFQSLSGFLRPCNWRIQHNRAFIPLFQSLSGFLRPCNSSNVLTNRVRIYSFNPYRVFSGLATRPFSRTPTFRMSLVSIPIGFSQALQHKRLAKSGGLWVSFNPYRVFSGLATSHQWQFPSSATMFQSLSGFLRPCNASPNSQLRMSGYVSIPIGFSQALQR